MKKLFLSSLAILIVGCGQQITASSPLVVNPEILYEHVAKSEDPFGSFEALTQEQKLEVLKLWVPVRTEREVKNLPLEQGELYLQQAGCRVGEATEALYGSFGPIVSLNTYIDYCSNGQMFTYISARPARPQIYSPGWRYLGLQSNYARGGVGSSSASMFTNGHFRSEINGVNLRDEFIYVVNTVSAY